MIKTIKVKILPNNKQKTKMFQFCGAKRFAYNWALSRQKENYENGGKFLNDLKLRKEFTVLKRTQEYEWIKDISNNVTKQAIKDSCLAFEKFFKKKGGFPKFKSKKKDRPSFYVDSCKILFSKTHVKLEKISSSKKRNRTRLNYIKLAEKGRIPLNCKYYNPHVVYDGIDWFICVGIECRDNKGGLQKKEIGIDLGIKDLAICSDGKKYPNINNTQKMKKLEKRKRRLQRSISRRYEKNKNGESYCKTSNLIKIERELLKLNHRLANIRQNYLHQTTAEIVKTKPSYIVLEDLNVSGMMKNKHLSKAVQQQSFYEFRRQIEYKSAWNHISVILADRFFPSSKLCSCCGSVKKDLKLSDRIYRCECGNVIDRDYQASLNLKRYGENVLKQSVI